VEGCGFSGRRRTFTEHGNISDFGCAAGAARQLADLPAVAPFPRGNAANT